MTILTNANAQSAGKPSNAVGETNMPEGPATVLGGLPVWAEVWYSRGDGYSSDDDAGVDALYWRKRDGTKGAPLSEKVMERIEKKDYWECDVCDQVFDYLAHEQYLQECRDKYRCEYCGAYYREGFTLCAPPYKVQPHAFTGNHPADLLERTLK